MFKNRNMIKFHLKTFTNIHQYSLIIRLVTNSAVLTLSRHKTLKRHQNKVKVEDFCLTLSCPLDVPVCQGQGRG